MKVLMLEEHGASYCVSAKDRPRPISDISENDVLAIVDLILDGIEIEMDEPPVNYDSRNPAELVIYRELHKQFKALTSKREEKLKAIDDRFKDARAFYCDEGLKNDLFNLGQESAEEPDNRGV